MLVPCLEQRLRLEHFAQQPQATVDVRLRGADGLIEHLSRLRVGEALDMPQHDGNCKQEMLERTGTTIRYRFSCTGERPTTGEGEYTMTSPTTAERFIMTSAFCLYFCLLSFTFCL